MDGMELAIKSFEVEKNKFDIEYKKYLLECRNAGENTVILINNIELLKSLREAIMWVVELFDNTIHMNISEKKFISGIRYVNNVFKHNKFPYNLNEICREAINISIEIDESSPVDSKIQNISLTPELIFGTMSNIPKKQEFNNQRNNYMYKIKGKKVTDVLNISEELVKKYYRKES